MKTLKNAFVAFALATLVSLASLTATASESNTSTQVFYRTVKIDGLDIFLPPIIPRFWSATCIEPPLPPHIPVALP